VIAIIPTADKTNATVQVRVGFKDKDTRILPQMGARVSFLATESSPARPLFGTEDKVVIVPSAAVKTGSDRGTGILFVIDGTTVVERTVQLGANNGNDQWILSGLDPGARVAVGDFSKLHDGVRIRITQ
jgi:multidrug efflux pump subunit AcrA (membrane-fusion protein)